MTENLYCKIFIDTISEYIVSDWCILSIRKNKDFLYWKFIIDIENKNVPENTYINNIRQFIYFLKKNNSVVCACDFEERLI